MIIIVIERHRQILDPFKIKKHIEMAAFCELHNVYIVTIRKDLKLLVEKGLLYKTHRGASFEILTSTKNTFNKRKRDMLKKNQLLRNQPRSLS